MVFFFFLFFLTSAFGHRKRSLLSTSQFGIEQSSFSAWTWLLFCSQTGTNLCIAYLYLDFVRLTFVSDGLLNYFYMFLDISFTEYKFLIWYTYYSHIIILQEAFKFFISSKLHCKSAGTSGKWCQGSFCTTKVCQYSFITQ